MTFNIRNRYENEKNPFSARSPLAPTKKKRLAAISCEPQLLRV